MSRSHWRREQTSKVRRVLKDVNLEVGDMTGKAIGKMHYGAGINRTSFAKIEIEYKEKDNA